VQLIPSAVRHAVVVPRTITRGEDGYSALSANPTSEVLLWRSKVESLNPEPIGPILERPSAVPNRLSQLSRDRAYGDAIGSASWNKDSRFL